MREAYLKNVQMLIKKIVEELEKRPDIPLIGDARRWVKNKPETYEFVREVDFTILKDLLGKNYIYYIVYYEKLADQLETNLQEKRYMIMMNLLAALKEENGMRNRFEKWLLDNKIKKLYEDAH